MTGWRALVLRIMRVPHAPSPPPGSAPRVFRASPKYFTFRAILWGIGTLVLLHLVLGFYGFGSYFLPRHAPPAVSRTIGVLGGLLVFLLLVRLTFGFAVMRLDYELRWYMISDRAIRIREGIVTVREKTIALANIQNTVVRQGPLQRLLGIADVEVTTAGGGAGAGGKQHGEQLGEPMHVGYFRGVDNAAEIRAIVQEGVRRHRDAGVGDPDDHAVVAKDPAEALLRETRLLRELLEARL